MFKVVIYEDNNGVSLIADYIAELDKNACNSRDSPCTSEKDISIF